MAIRAPLCLVSVLTTLALAPPAEADPPATSDAPAPPASATSKGPAPLPKPGPRGTEHVAASQLPPFFGFFGSADLIARVGFRGKPGSYIEYSVQPTSEEAGAGKGLRIAEVGPAVPGGRWIEISGNGPGADGLAIRLLTEGEGVGNVRRLIVQGPQTPPIELPLDALTTDMPVAMPGGNSGDSLLSDAKHLGTETLALPIGKFQTEHWLVASKKGHRLEIWTTRDERIPFTGCVKMRTDKGVVVARKFGTDAAGVVTVPPLQHGDGD